MQYYFIIQVDGTDYFLGMAMPYGEPDLDLLRASSYTYYSVPQTRTLEVVDLHTISSVVMAAPDMRYKYFRRDGTEMDHWIIVLKSGQRSWKR